MPEIFRPTNFHAAAGFSTDIRGHIFRFLGGESSIYIGESQNVLGDAVLILVLRRRQLGYCLSLSKDVLYVLPQVMRFGGLRGR
jgi:hypothetical protein